MKIRSNHGFACISCPYNRIGIHWQSSTDEMCALETAWQKLACYSHDSFGQWCHSLCWILGGQWWPCHIKPKNETLCFVSSLSVWCKQPSCSFSLSVGDTTYTPSLCFSRLLAWEKDHNQNANWKCEISMCHLILACLWLLRSAKILSFPMGTTLSLHWTGMFICSISSI